MPQSLNLDFCHESETIEEIALPRYTKSPSGDESSSYPIPRSIDLAKSPVRITTLTVADENSNITLNSTSETFSPPPGKPSPVKREPYLPLVGRRRLLSVTREWLFEVVSCLLAITCLVAVVAILLKFDHTALTKWPYLITVNSLISILVTILRALLLLLLAEGISQLKWSWFRGKAQKLEDLAIFDEASRGPWGATRLIFLAPAWNLGTIGALLMLLSLTIGPFAQQLVLINSESVQTDELATVGSCSTEYIDEIQGDNMTRSGDEFWSPQPATIGAIYRGLFQNNTNEFLHPLCATGNCSYGFHQSLSICSKCVNLTDHIITYSQSTGQPIPLSRCRMENENSQCIHRLPNSLMVDPEHKSLDNSSTIFVREERDKVITRVFNATMEWESWPEPRPAIWLNPLSFTNFSAIFYNGDDYDDASSEEPSKASRSIRLPESVSAIGCSLYYCIQSYNSSVVSGEYKELVQEIATKNSFNEDEKQWTLTPEKCSSQNPNMSSSYDKDENCSRNIRTQTMRSLTQALDDTLIGSAYFGSKNYAIWSWDSTAAIANLDGLSYTERKISDLAESLSSNLRANKNICKGAIKGIAWTNRSYIYVNWIWLTLPIASTVFTCAFIITVIYRTQGMDAWKSSPLPLFFSILEYEECEKRTTRSVSDSKLMADLNFKEMGKVSKTMMVRLNEEGGLKVAG